MSKCIRCGIDKYDTAYFCFECRDVMEEKQTGFLRRLKQEPRPRNNPLFMVPVYLYMAAITLAVSFLITMIGFFLYFFTK